MQANPVETQNEDGTVSKNYFTYKGVKYSGYDYKGDVTPTITNAVYKHFQGAAGSPCRSRKTRGNAGVPPIVLVDVERKTSDNRVAACRLIGKSRADLCRACV